MSFAPIAIVGRACLLPGAHTPQELFALTRDGRDQLRDAPAGRWRVPDAHVVATEGSEVLDHTWTRRGGYVEGFEFDREGYRVPPSELTSTDPLVHWVLDTARKALTDADLWGTDAAETGAVLGNLSLPSSAASRFAEGVWLGDLADRVGIPRAVPDDRFNSGLPAHLLARALGLGRGAYSLDAACASSLYAIEHACRALQEGRADRMLAGAVNGADDLFLHIGFSALGAMSKTGQSRPFHRDANGLVAAEGCGFVVLERLEDAVRAGRTIHGVIRGVGLCNDGRGKGLLAPSQAGQERAMRIGLEQAGVDARDVPYIECHATGTPVGDACEVASMTAVYGNHGARIGSLKSNLGHLITTAGVAGLIKVLESLREGVMLPTAHQSGRDDAPLGALESSPFETLDRPIPWEGPRRAGLSAFGFGGNDAHLIVEAYDPSASYETARTAVAAPIVVVAVGARVGDGQSTADLEGALAGGTLKRAETVRIPLTDLRFPPDDLKKASGQQTMLLSATLEATAGLTLPAATTGVFVGYQCAPEVSRWCARWRARSWGETLGADAAWIEEAQDAFVPPLEAPHVLGVLPNIPANRLSSQLDLRGPSFTVSAEELSGIRALELAIEGLSRGDLDAALVGAVDLSTEPVHRAASGDDGGADAAIMLVLRRGEDAAREGLPILGEVRVGPSTAEAFATGLPRAHAAVGLVEVASALICVARGRRPDGSPWTDIERRLSVTVDALGGQSATAEVHAVGTPAAAFAPAPDGPSLELSAHRPTVALPALPAHEGIAMQKMQPAPVLPPTSYDGPATLDKKAPREAARGDSATQSSTRRHREGGPRRQRDAVAQSRQADRSGAGSAQSSQAGRPPAVAPGVHGAAPVAPVVPGAPVAAGPASVAAVPAGHPVSAFAQHQVAMAEAHMAFVEQQAQLHQQFLQTILMPLGSVPEAVPVPVSGAVSVHVPEAVPVPVPVHVPVPEAVPLDKKAPREAARGDSAPEASRAVRPPAVAPGVLADPSVSDPVSEAAHVRVELPLAFRPSGPAFTREDLLTHSGGAISEIFGPLFARQDGFDVQVRMPEPPLLLADRCTGIQAEPGSMKKGTCWTETDVREDSWYLHDGQMPAGIMIESGQADLFLISYLGADFLNKGERAYRLLGCEMTWHGDLPQIGETLVYDIHVDGHAAQGDIRLFFFHYDCHIKKADGTTRPALSVRHGQAGFFTRAELDDSEGILWDPEEDTRDDARLDAPIVPLEARSYDRASIEAFAEGRPWECFGEGFMRTRTHTRTPRIQSGRMLFLDTIETLDPQGGPWGRGYFKAVTPITPDDWYFDGHFKNDPCMPGTLMLEGCVQAMAFYLTAMGYTVGRDGWRFQPIPDEAYALICRGQAIPTSKEITYELFVEEVHDGPIPRLYADVLCTIDGLGAFHARRFGVELVPSWPMTSRPELREEGKGNPRAAVASYQGGPPFRFDLPSLLACAWDRPSAAFGPMYERFDGHRRPARLPGPPYHFLSLVTKVDGEIGGLESGTTFEFEYEVPPDVWYFDENGAPVMPFAVLLEAALQPCGWTASYVGSALTVDTDLLFRNLDGTGTIKCEVFPESGTLRTTVKVKSISRSAGMIIISFEVHCYLGETEVYELDTVFGFFPPEAFKDQAGLPLDDAHRAAFAAPSDTLVDLTAEPPRYCAGSLRLANPMLLMIDRITHLDHQGGAAGLGIVKAEKDIDPSEWFFKAHFYQDPVQPGSLGIEAMLQALQFLMIDRDLGADMESPRFEGIATNREHVWKYRGQVIPEATTVTTTLEIVETGTDEVGVYALADASLWVDGKRIYEAFRLGMRIVDDALPPRGPKHEDDADPKDQAEVLDPEEDLWLKDHRPTYTAPALPMMSMVDRMMAAARADRGDEVVAGLSNLMVERWLVVDGPTRVRTEVEGDEVRVLVWRDAKDPRLSRFEVAARATIGAPSSLEPLPPVGETTALAPYADDRLFHGTAFHYVRKLEMGAAGARAILDAGAGTVPYGTLNQGLLDAITHLIPHDRLHEWSDHIGDDVVGYPRRLDIRFDGDAPRQGIVHGEVRFVGFDDEEGRFPVFRAQLIEGDRVFADLRLVEILMPKGPIGKADPKRRRRFLEGVASDGVGLGRRDGDRGGATILDPRDVALSDWFPGTLAALYGTDDPRAIAIKEHVGARVGSHPSSITIRGDAGIDAHAPLTAHPVRIEEAQDDRGGDTLIVQDAGPARLDIATVQAFWREYFDIGTWPVEELYYGLVERFVGAVHVEDPAALGALRGRGVLYLGNHQTGIESLIFSIVASALQGIPTLTLAKTEHRTSWLGQLIAHCFTWPGVDDPGVIAYFDRSDPTSLVEITKKLAGAAGAKSLMVHVEGTRAHAARHRVESMSGVFCDLAINAGVPIVPVRFSGGLPVTPSADKLEYPVAMGRQDYYLGRPIFPRELSALPYKERTEHVMAAINSLGPNELSVELPLKGDASFAAAVDARVARTGVPVGLSTIVEVLRAREDAGPHVKRLLEAVDAGTAPAFGDEPEERWLRDLARMFQGS